MQHEHSYRDDVGVAQVVDKTADVAIVTSVNAVHLPVLWRDTEGLVRERKRCRSMSYFNVSV